MPYAASARVAALLSQHGVEHELHTIDGAEHGLGAAGLPGRATPNLEQQVDQAYAAAIAFMEDKWQRPGGGGGSKAAPKL